MSFFGPRLSKVPATVTAPPPIQPTSFIPQKSTIREAPDPVSRNLSHPDRGCPSALQLLSSFHKRILSLPKDTTEAGIDHPLARFSIDPVGCVKDGEDAWETWDGPLNSLLQKDPQELNELVVVRQRGLEGLHRFLSYLVLDHGIQGGLLEGKLERLFAAIDRV